MGYDSFDFYVNSRDFGEVWFRAKPYSQFRVTVENWGFGNEYERLPFFSVPIYLMRVGRCDSCPDVKLGDTTLPIMTMEADRLPNEDEIKERGAFLLTKIRDHIIKLKEMNEFSEREMKRGPRPRTS